jgi:hypothetical protein
MGQLRMDGERSAPPRTGQLTSTLGKHDVDAVWPNGGWRRPFGVLAWCHNPIHTMEDGSWSPTPARICREFGRSPRASTRQQHSTAPPPIAVGFVCGFGPGVCSPCANERSTTRPTSLCVALSPELPGHAKCKARFAIALSCALPALTAFGHPRKEKLSKLASIGARWL